MLVFPERWWRWRSPEESSRGGLTRHAAWSAAAKLPRAAQPSRSVPSLPALRWGMKVVIYFSPFPPPKKKPGAIGDTVFIIFMSICPCDEWNSKTLSCPGLEFRV